MVKHVEERQAAALLSGGLAEDDEEGVAELDELREVEDVGPEEGRPRRSGPGRITEYGVYGGLRGSCGDDAADCHDG